MMHKRILLIDDDELLRDVVAQFLELSGYGVTTAGNGREGLERLDEGTFDLIVLDLLMPEMDGIRFLHRQAEDVPEPTPVLVLSASATADMVDALKFPSVRDVVRKPVKPAALLEKIAALLGGGGARVC